MAAWLFSLLLGVAFAEGLVLICLACYVFASSGLAKLVTSPQPLPQAMEVYNITSSSLIVPAVLILIAGFMLIARSILMLLALFMGKPFTLLQETADMSGVDIFTGMITRPAGVDIDVTAVQGMGRPGESGEPLPPTEEPWTGEEYEWTEGGGVSSDVDAEKKLSVEDIYGDPSAEEPWTTELSDQGTYAGQRADQTEGGTATSGPEGTATAPEGTATAEETATSAPSTEPQKQMVLPPARQQRQRGSAPFRNTSLMVQQEQGPQNQPSRKQATISSAAAANSPLRLQADDSQPVMMLKREVARVTAAETIVNIVSRFGDDGTATQPRLSSKPQEFSVRGSAAQVPLTSVGQTATAAEEIETDANAAGITSGSTAQGDASAYAESQPKKSLVTAVPPTQNTQQLEMTSQSAPPETQSAEPEEVMSAPVEISTMSGGGDEDQAVATYQSPTSQQGLTEEGTAGAAPTAQVGRTSGLSPAPGVFSSKAEVSPQEEVAAPQLLKQERARVMVSSTLVNIAQQNVNI